MVTTLIPLGRSSDVGHSVIKSMFEFGTLMWNESLVNIQALIEVGASTELSCEKGTLDRSTAQLNLSLSFSHSCIRNK